MPFLRHEPICKSGSGRQTGIKENGKGQARIPSNSPCSVSIGWECPVYRRNGQKSKGTAPAWLPFSATAGMRNILKSEKAVQPNANGRTREKRLPTEISHDIISGRLLFHFLFVRTIFSLPSENLALFLTS